jgi:ABC-type amino acid transport substrate-binding protein
MLKHCYLLFIIPLLFFSNVGILNANAESKTQLNVLLSLVSNMSDTVHSLQQERGASCGVVSSSDGKFKSKLERISKNSDEKIKKLLIGFNTNKILLGHYFTDKEFTNLNTKFNELYLLRDVVKNKKINFAKVYSKYTQIIASLLLNISDISDKPQNEALRDKLYAYSTLLMYKESIGQKRAALSALFSQNFFSKEIYEYFLTSDTQEKIYLKTFLHSVDKNTQELYAKTLDNEVVIEVQNYEKQAHDKLNGNEVNADPVKWFESVTKKINLVQSVEYKIFENILILVDKLNNNFSSSLTQEEHLWLSKHKSIKVGVEQWAPVIFSNTGSDIDGIGGDFTKEISKLTGLKIVVLNDKWNNLLSAFKNKKIDLLPATYYTTERSKYGLYSTGYFKMKDYLYVKDSVNDIKSLKNLNGKKLALIKDYGTIPKIQNKYPNINLVFTKDLDESIQMLLDGRVDALYEGGVAVDKKIGDELITGVKGFPETSFEASSLHLFSRVDEPVLHSILQKALGAIKKEEKRKIISKWFKNTVNTKAEKVLDIAFTFDRPPYMFEKTSSKGIEADVVKEIFQLEDYDVNINQMAKRNMEKILNANKTYDAVASISDNGTGYFYSDKYTKYENYAITRKSDNIKMNSLDDLAGHDFISWENAYNDLGLTFYKYFNPQDGIYKSSYHDKTSQEEQHKLFFDKKYDVLIVDKMIFQWYKNNLKNTDEYTFHKIFPLATDGVVRFRDKKLRDIFNVGLKKIIKSGRYDEIVNFYLKQDIRPLLKYSNLMADISGRFIFSAEPKKLKKVLNKFFIHPDIVHIQVYDKTTDSTFLSLYKKEGEIIDGKDKGLYHHLPSITKKIYITNKDNPLHVGKINIFYKHTFKNSRGELIPKISDFLDIDKNDLKKVKRTYEKFGLNTKVLHLTKQEKEWLNNHKIISFAGDPNWMPLESFNDKGEYVGIVADYIKII